MRILRWAAGRVLLFGERVIAELHVLHTEAGENITTEAGEDITTG